MGRSDRSQQFLTLVLLGGLVASSILLLRFANDLGRTSALEISVAFWGLVLASITTGTLGLGFGIVKPLGRKTQIAFALVIPLSLVASGLDCTGLQVQGCSTACSLIRLGLIPITALVAGALVLVPVTEKLRHSLLLTLAVACVLALTPHCVCHNPGNGWWIDRIGSSPVCYAWGVMASTIAISALWKGRVVWLSLAICCAIIAGSLAFFVGHHYFDYPW